MSSLRLNTFRCGKLSSEQGSAKIRNTGAGPGPSAYEMGVPSLVPSWTSKDAFIKYPGGLMKA